MAIPATIHPFSLEALGTFSGGLRNLASAGWPAANRAAYFPFAITEQITVKQLFAYIGSANTGNIDIGIYDSAGTRLVSSGATAAGTTNTLQVFDVADTVLPAGRYFLAMVCSATTVAVMRKAAGNAADINAMGVAQENLGATTLPTTATFAAIAGTPMWAFGLATNTVV